MSESNATEAIPADENVIQESLTADDYSMIDEVHGTDKFYESLMILDASRIGETQTKQYYVLWESTDGRETQNADLCIYELRQVERDLQKLRAARRARGIGVGSRCDPPINFRLPPRKHKYTDGSLSTEFENS